MRRGREGENSQPAGASGDGREALTRHLYEEGVRSWPELALPAETFVAYVAARTPEGKSAANLQAGDLFLACACASGVPGALDTFDRAYMGRVGLFLARLHPSAEQLDEVRQVVREKLFVGRDGAPPRITEYDGQGALASWVRVVAVRTAIDLQRRQGAAQASAERERERGVVDPATRDPELAYIKRGYRKAFDDAFRVAVLRLDGEQRELLRLHFVEGLTLDALAAKLGVHRATVARRIAAGREAIAEEARRLLGDQLGATRSEVDSIVGLMRSHLDLSIAGLLRVS